MEIREARKEEMESYYRLRWEILRKPWNQPYGSERDELEKNAIHIVAVEDNRVIGVARLHFNSPTEAQVRYMAVDEDYRNRGIGSKMIHLIEKLALNKGAVRIVLDARENAVEFYKKNGYKVIKPSKVLFGEIKHLRMEKKIQNV